MCCFLQLQFESNTSHFCGHFLGQSKLNDQSKLNGFKGVQKNNPPAGKELALGGQLYDLLQWPLRAKGDALGPENL